jgi:hypothetical protein
VCKWTLNALILDVAMDATNMSFRDNSFDVAIDKGTYDALAVRYLPINELSADRNLKRRLGS